MEIRQIRYFLAVADHGSFNAAAAAIRVSQPSLSVSVRHLESELGTPLLVRGARGVALTAAGCTFAQYARSVLREADKAVEEVKRLKDPRHGKVTCGITAVFSTFIAPQAIAAFHRRRPEVDVVADVSTHTPEQIRDNLATGAWDFAFVLHRPDAEIAADVSVEYLAEFASGVYAASNHPLAGQTDVSAEDLARFTWIVSSYGTGATFLERAFDRAGLARPDIRLASNSFNLMREMLDQYPFLSMLPHRFVARDVAAGQLVQIDQRVIAITSRVGLIYSARTELTGPTRDLMDAFRDVCR